MDLVMIDRVDLTAGAAVLAFRRIRSGAESFPDVSLFRPSEDALGEKP